MEPLSSISGYSNEEDRLALMRVKRKTFAPSGSYPDYKIMAAFPGDVIYGLKFWMIDGIVHYRKRLRHETVVGDEEREHILAHLSDTFLKELLQVRNDEQEWDSFGWWTPLMRAGEGPIDYDLYLFLVHRDVDFLWWILMGTVQAPKGQFFFHFQTEFDDEGWGKREKRNLEM